MRECAQVLDQALEQSRLLHQSATRHIVARIDAVDSPSSRPRMIDERRAQLVRDVGHQVAALLLLRLRAVSVMLLNARATERRNGGPRSTSCAE